MNRFDYGFAALLAVVGVALDAWAFISRCPASPTINVSILCFGLLVQATAVAFPVIRGSLFETSSLKHELGFICVMSVLFLGSVLVIRYSVLYSDAIGKPNYFKSAGLACRLAG